MVQLLGLWGPKCSGIHTASTVRVMVLSESLFELPVAGDQKASLASLCPQLCLFRYLEGSLAWDPSLLFGASGTQRGPPGWGPTLYIRHLKGHPGWGPTLQFSVVQYIRHLMASLPIVQLLMLVCGEREAMVMAPPPMHDLAVLPCFHRCLAFLHRHFPPQSPPSHPLNLSLCSQQQPLPWDCSTIPKPQLPAAVPSRGSASLSRVCMVAVRTV